MTIDVLKDGWAVVPLPQGLHVREARLGSAPLAIVDGPFARTRDGCCSRSVVAPSSRSTSSSRSSGVPAPSRSCCRLSRSGLVSATVMLPRPDVEVAASGWPHRRQGDCPGSLRVVSHASGRPSPGADLASQARHDARRVAVEAAGDSAAGRRPRRGDGADHGAGHAPTSCRALRLGARARRCLPDVTINQVQGAHVADWEVQGDHASRHAARAGRSPGHASLVTGEFRPPPAGRDRCAAAAGRRRRTRDGWRRGRSARRRRGHGARGARPRSGRSFGPRRSGGWPHIAGPRRVPLPRPAGRAGAHAGADDLALHAAVGAARRRRRGALSRPAHRGRQGARRRPAGASATTSAASSA